MLSSVGPARLWSQVRHLQFGHCGLWASQRQGAFPGHATHSGNQLYPNCSRRMCSYTQMLTSLSIVCVSVWILPLRCCFRSCAVPTAACWTWLPSRLESWGVWRCRALGWTLALGRVWPRGAWRTAPLLLPRTDLKAPDPKTTLPRSTTWSSCVCSSSLSAGDFSESAVRWN